MMKVVLTGSTGMLGSAFAEALGSSAVLTKRDDLDIKQVNRVDSFIASHSPDVVINCAAHVDAEVAERDLDISVGTNTILPGLLGVSCRRHKAVLLHFSSTGCYGSWKDQPYTEDDPLIPTTKHHTSKLNGEAQIVASGCEHLILRTGWLFGGSPRHIKNFVWKRLVEANIHKVIHSDTSQIGNPTFVSDVVTQAIHLLEAGVRGTYNCVARERASRYEYVKRIVEVARIDCKVEPTGAFQRLAPVSPNESALNYRLGLMALDQMPLWKTSLDSYVRQVVARQEYTKLNLTGSLQDD